MCTRQKEKFGDCVAEIKEIIGILGRGQYDIQDENDLDDLQERLKGLKIYIPDFRCIDDKEIFLANYLRLLKFAKRKDLASARKRWDKSMIDLNIQYEETLWP